MTLASAAIAFASFFLLTSMECDFVTLSVSDNRHYSSSTLLWHKVSPTTETICLWHCDIVCLWHWLQSPMCNLFPNGADPPIIAMFCTISLEPQPIFRYVLSMIIIPLIIIMIRWMLEPLVRAWLVQNDYNLNEGKVVMLMLAEIISEVW